MTKSIALLALVTTAACASGGGGSQPVAPAEPEQTVAQFLAAVQATSLARMGELWGSSRGPASQWMEEEELRRRLSVMVVYLQHERYEITPQVDPVLRGTGNERRVRVQLTRSGCTPTVPFTLVRWRDGWIISNIDLTVIGNPARACEPRP